MTDSILLKDVEFKGEPVITHPYLEPSKETRIYYVAEEPEGSGFIFIVLGWYGRNVTDEDSYDTFDWNPERTDVQVLYHGIACFDGIRHLYMGKAELHNEGYLYYPDLIDHITIMKNLRELEVKHCRDYE